MDIRMPDTDGIEATRRILAETGESPPRVLILTTFDLDEYVYDALRAGASGFLLKDVPPEQLAAGIRMVHARRSVARPQHHPATHRRIHHLGPPAPGRGRPRRCRRSAPANTRCFGCSPAATPTSRSPSDLIVGETTVKTHVTRILTKLDLRDRVQVVVLAYESGIITPGRSD